MVILNYDAEILNGSDDFAFIWTLQFWRTISHEAKRKLIEATIAWIRRPVQARDLGPKLFGWFRADESQATRLLFEPEILAYLDTSLLIEVEHYCGIWCNRITEAKQAMKTEGASLVDREFFNMRFSLADWQARRASCMNTLHQKREIADKIEFIYRLPSIKMQNRDGVEVTFPVEQIRYATQLKLQKHPIRKGIVYSDNRSLFSDMFKQQRETLDTYFTSVSLSYNCEITNPFLGCESVQNINRPLDASIFDKIMDNAEMLELLDVAMRMAAIDFWQRYVNHVNPVNIQMP